VAGSRAITFFQEIKELQSPYNVAGSRRYENIFSKVKVGMT
jgi:hypothetical protein